MSVLSKLFGSSTTEAVGPTDAQDLLRRGALLLDVREQGEWDIPCGVSTPRWIGFRKVAPSWWSAGPATAPPGPPRC
jgi:hypothetical protein